MVRAWRQRAPSRPLGRHAQEDLYAALQVVPSAEPEVIEAAYRALARKYHPDVSAAANADTRMRSINAAYAVLSDRQLRFDYDRAHQSASRPRTTGPSPSRLFSRGIVALVERSSARWTVPPPRVWRSLPWVLAALSFVLLVQQADLAVRVAALSGVHAWSERRASQRYWQYVRPLIEQTDAARIRYRDTAAATGSFGTAIHSSAFRSAAPDFVAQLEAAAGALRKIADIPQPAVSAHFALLQQWSLEMEIASELRSAAVRQDFVGWTRAAALELNLPARERQTAAALSELRRYLGP